MTKTDLKKTLSACYTATPEARILDVPRISYVCYPGTGDPNTSTDFQDAMGVLYGLAYTIKFKCKGEDRDFAVMPLEGQWWAADPEDFRLNRKENWMWKLMIAVPDYVTAPLFTEGKEKLAAKKNPPGLDRASLETMTDGLSAQFLYIGPYAEEDSYIAAMHKWVEEKGYRLRGRHREIYLNSPQRVSPDKLRTIIRHPVEKIQPAGLG